MKNAIQFREYPLDIVLNKLLEDKTTGKRIIWATNSYSEYGTNCCDRYEISPGVLQGTTPIPLQPRAFKTLEAQQQRTKSKAEVFTPSWIVNKMVGHLDEEWFGRPDVFNKEDGQNWDTVPEKIEFTDEHSWQDYVDRSVLEITCGEAPFIVSRYNASTGDLIPIKDRIGILDRKLRVVTENTETEKDWIKWAKRAYESVYGYEYQGDNLLIGRVNLLMTFIDYYQASWDRLPDKNLLSAIVNIITWNFWQMDGLHGTVPLGVPQPLFEQLTLFGFEEETDEKAPLCTVRKWRSKSTILYKEIEAKEGSEMANRKFDVVIGNPPYQGESNGEERNYAPPVYNLFLDEAYKVAVKVEMIHPARFLFNAGSTPKKWNEAMLNDRHFKVLLYEPDSNQIFPSLSTPIKGGVAITYRDSTNSYSPILAFSPYPAMNNVLQKVTKRDDFIPLSSIAYSRTSFRLTEKLHADFPEAREKLSKGHDYDMSSNIFTRIPEVFHDEDQGTGDYLKILGRENGKRVSKFIKREYVNNPVNLDHYKVYVPQASGSGLFGEVIGSPIPEGPGVGATETFLSIGNFKTKDEAIHLKQYLKTKFLRSLLGVLKVTQNGNIPVWKMIPIQNFTSKSDIDWSVSIPEIDQQLYKKYGLSPEEIDFIETHVKEME